MSRFWTVAVLSTALISLPQVATNAATISFTSTLNGAQENPPVDTQATGAGTGNLSGEPGSFVFNYEVNYSGLRGGLVAPLAHIHSGARGVNGPIIHDLDNARSFVGTTEGIIKGDWRFDDPTSPLVDGFAQELLNGNLYFNIHSEFSPSGEIRGQIEEVPEPSSALGVLMLGALGAFQLKKQRRRKSASGVTSVSE